MKSLKNNKTGLSYILDATMREGHHDMFTFGVGFLRSLSSKQEQAHLIASLRAPYSVMEKAFDEAHPKSRIHRFWSKFSSDLRKAPSLANDVKMLGGNNLPILESAKYVAVIQDAAEDSDDGPERFITLSFFEITFFSNIT